MHGEQCVHLCVTISNTWYWIYEYKWAQDQYIFNIYKIWVFQIFVSPQQKYIIILLFFPIAISTQLKIVHNAERETSENAE